MIATQVYVLTMRAQRTENSRQNEFVGRVFKPSNRGEFFDLQHTENLSFDVDDVRYNLWLQRSYFAKIIDKSDGWSQIGVSVRRQFVESGIASVKKL